MGGKSTFLRQNALIAVLAQAGSFVPAARAKLGLVDRLFSRVGASDNLARGRSTFMVEMVETAAILAQATPRSFVILDEVGRGTSTYDGLAIAWAVVEAMHDQVNAAACLFATHYHELTRLAERLDALSLHHVRAREWKGDLVLLHEVADGAADRSYGIAVAKLAGLPPAVVARAKSVLAKLEAGRDATGGIAAGLDDLPLFAAAAEPEHAPDPLARRSTGSSPTASAPREALELLYRAEAARGRARSHEPARRRPSPRDHRPPRDRRSARSAAPRQAARPMPPRSSREALAAGRAEIARRLDRGAGQRPRRRAGHRLPRTTRSSASPTISSRSRAARPTAARAAGAGRRSAATAAARWRPFSDVDIVFLTAESADAWSRSAMPRRCSTCCGT